MKFVKRVQLRFHVGDTGNQVKVSQCSNVIIFLRNGRVPATRMLLIIARGATELSNVQLSSNNWGMGTSLREVPDGHGIRRTEGICSRTFDTCEYTRPYYCN